MLKVENVVTPSDEQWEAVVMGVRNPYASWEKSDSKWDNGFVIGEADLALMKKLSKAGTDHGKFMRMLPVICDITAPLYWWPEMDQYKIGTVTNSCSTIHSIHKKEFIEDDFSFENLIGKRSLEEIGYDVEYDYSLEEWKQLKEPEGYSISSFGRLRNDKTGYIHKACVNSSNYKKYTVKAKNYYAHRLVAETFLPNENNLPQVNHKDCNKWNNDVNNLEWVSVSENARHAFEHGLRNVSGYTRYRVSRTAGRFSAEEIEKIHTLFNDGYTKKQIAEEMNCYDSLICNILSGKTYVEIEMTPYDTAKLVIDHLNELRNKYNETKDVKYWNAMIAILPRAYNQRRTWFCNYQTLKNIYHARKNHKLGEWHTFCDWIKTVPYAELITGEE